MGNNLKYPVLSSLVALNFIMGKGFGVRILAFETRSCSDTILWSMLAAGNSYGWKLHFWKNQQFLLSKNIKNLLGKLNWSDNCTWIKKCILLYPKTTQLCSNTAQFYPKYFLRNGNTPTSLLRQISFAYEFAIYSFQLISLKLVS